MIRRRLRAQLLRIAGLAVALGSQLATAKEAAVLSVHGGATTIDGAAAIQRILRTRGQLDVLTDEEVTARLMTGAPALPVVPREAVSTLSRDSADLLRTVAFGEDGTAIERGRAVLARERARAVALNRSDASAMDLSDVCFFVVRALLHRGDSDAGREQARECLHLVPDASPGQEKHPPAVRTLVSSIDSEPKGRVAVNVVARGGESCVLRVQGRPFGRPPMVVELLPGPYALELDCGSGVGRLHQTTVTAAQMTSVRIAPNLDASLRVREGAQPSLDPAASPLSGIEMALLRGELLVDELWIIDSSRKPAQVIRTWTEHAQTKTRASEVEMTPDERSTERLERVASALACNDESCRESEQRAHFSPSPLGLGMGISGLAAIAASWVLYAPYARSHSELDQLVPGTPAFNDELKRRDDFATAAWVTSAVGSAAVASAAPMLLPSAKGVPWWAIATGVAGAGLAGVGTAVWLRNGTLEEHTCAGFGSCLREESTVPLGPMLVFNGASLLAVPATYLVRSLFDDGPSSAGISVTRDGALFVLTQRTPF